MTDHPAPSPLNWLDDQEFYEAMQLYRHTPITDQKATVKAFEAVKKLIRKKSRALLGGSK